MVDPGKVRRGSRRALEGGFQLPWNVPDCRRICPAPRLVRGAQGAGRTGQTAEWLAEQLGQNATQVRRKLDGDYPVLAEDILGWSIALETVEVIHAPGTTDDLLPPTPAGGVSVAEDKEVQ